MNVLLASGSVVENVPIVVFVPEPSLILLTLKDIEAGVSFTLDTFIVNVVSKNCPSELVIRTLIEYDDLASKLKTSELLNCVPEILKLPLSPLPVPDTNVYVYVSLIGTAVCAENVPIT